MSIRGLLDDIMQNMAKDGKVFSNEQDFQFELALALKAEETVKDVKLEALSLSKEWDGQEVKRDDKEYTDLIFETHDGKYYAIELKNKHPGRSKTIYTPTFGNVLLMKHGAENINSFYFWKDIYRLEEINNRHFSNEMQFEKGYAIFLSNSSKYWTSGFSSDKWKPYPINNGRSIRKGEFDNCDNFKVSNREFVVPRIIGSYKLEWKDYPVEVFSWDKHEKIDEEFKYLLVEVDPRPKDSQTE